MRISALAQISCDVRYRRLQDKSPKIQGKTALWSWARSLTARTTPSATTLRRANMATLSSRVLSIRPRSYEPRCKMHPQWEGFLSPPRLWWRRNRSQRLRPCLLEEVWAAWATWTINRFTQATAKFGRPPALGGLSFDDAPLRGGWRDSSAQSLAARPWPLHVHCCAQWDCRAWPSP